MNESLGVDYFKSGFASLLFVLILSIQYLLLGFFKSINYSINMSCINFNNRVRKFTFFFVEITIFFKNINGWFVFISIDINGILFVDQGHFFISFNYLESQFNRYESKFQLVGGV